MNLYRVVTWYLDRNLPYISNSHWFIIEQNDLWFWLVPLVCFIPSYCMPAPSPITLPCSIFPSFPYFLQTSNLTSPCSSCFLSLNTSFIILYLLKPPLWPMIHLLSFSSPCSHASSAPSFPFCLPSCVFFAWRQAHSPLLPSCSPPSLYGYLWLLQSTRPSLYAACLPGHGLWSQLALFSLGLNVIANVPAWSLQPCVCACVWVWVCMLV